MAWSECDALHKIWTLNLTRTFKLQILKAAIEPILLYGSETWTLSKNLEKRLDGTFTRLLMRVQNLTWKRHPTKKEYMGPYHLFPKSSEQGGFSLPVIVVEPSVKLFRPFSCGNHHRHKTEEDKNFRIRMS